MFRTNQLSPLLLRNSCTCFTWLYTHTHRRTVLHMNNGCRRKTAGIRIRVFCIGAHSKNEIGPGEHTENNCLNIHQCSTVFVHADAPTSCPVVIVNSWFVRNIRGDRFVCDQFPICAMEQNGVFSFNTLLDPLYCHARRGPDGRSVYRIFSPRVL